jgi:hypothetical protein
MGCGCRGSKKSPVRTITPQVTNRVTQTRVRQAELSIQEINTKITGMSKEQRDAERKRRIQLIMRKKNLNNS